MPITISTLIQSIIGLALVMALLGYYLGKRKTDTPKTTAAIACVSAVVPPVALVILLVLLMKKDIDLA